jgi:Fe-S-cluster-containing hydrogenase component 2
MNDGMTKSGVLSKKMLSKLPGIPSAGRMEKGCVVMIECAQEIPCNPCESSCPRNAIRIGEDINNLPILDEDKCTGCGLCISACPGLAIFAIDLTYSEKKALVQLPHEFLSLPEKGATVTCFNHEGRDVSDGKVMKVSNPRSNDRTPVVSVAVDKEFAQEVRAIKIKGK